jgi:ACS family hexuronate transporter-like MFS transporter
VGFSRAESINERLRREQESRLMPARSPRVGSVRWVVCALLFLAATINYVDRQVIGILKPTLQQEFGWTEIDYSDIVFAFQLAYAIGFIFAGRVMDRLGTKRGFAIAIVIWSVAAAAHGFAPAVGVAVAPVLAGIGLGYSTSVAGFLFMRFLLGIGEAGNFPAAIKTVAEWFPKRERALATGLFNSGTNIGALVTPLVVPWLTVAYGWPAAFVATGLLGFLWLVVWMVFYHRPADHPTVSREELAFIQSEPDEAPVRVPWSTLVRYRQTWAFALGKFMTDPVWWLYLFWIPDFLSRTYGLDLLSMGPPLVVIYLLADVGSVLGGWLSSRLIGLGWSVNAARKTAMLICALAVTPIVFAPGIHHLWLAVGLIGLATAAHQGWSANLFTLTSDTFPRYAIGSVVGLGGMTGSIGGMLISKITGYVLQATGSYWSVFVIAGTAYLVALLVIHLLVPTLEPARLAEARSSSLPPPRSRG